MTETDRLQAELDHLYQEMGEAHALINTKSLEIELLKLELDQIFNGSADGMWVVDKNFCIQRINHVMATMLAATDDAVLGRKCFEIINCEAAGSDTCPMSHIRRGVRRYDRDTELTVTTDHTIPVIMTATPFRGIDGGLIGMLVRYKDITERHKAREALERANAELQRQATIDGLTQIANRRQFDQQLDMEWRRLRRDREALSLILCDIDFFKRYNDSCGHQEGDACLQKVARGLTGGTRRPADLVTRYGGEEFAAILPNTSSPGAQVVAENMRRQIAALRIPHPDSPVADMVTISMGIASCIPSADQSPEQLLAQADQALYQAKSQGRNRAVCASTE